MSARSLGLRAGHARRLDRPPMENAPSRHPRLSPQTHPTQELSANMCGQTTRIFPPRRRGARAFASEHDGRLHRYARAPPKMTRAGAERSRRGEAGGVQEQSLCLRVAAPLCDLQRRLEPVGHRKRGARVRPRRVVAFRSNRCGHSARLLAMAGKICHRENKQPLTPVGNSDTVGGRGSEPLQAGNSLRSSRLIAPPQGGRVLCSWRA